MRVCRRCGQERSEDRFGGRDICFACHVQGVQFGSVYRGGDKSFFRDVTDREFNRRTIEDGRRNGHDPVPVKRKVWV